MGRYRLDHPGSCLLYYHWFSVIRVLMSKLTDSANGQMCQVRIPGVCNFNPETTVPAHLDGGGVGTKRLDFFIAYCCSACHYVLHHGHPSFTRGELLTMHYEGVFRTQEIMYEKGLIPIKGDIHGGKRRKW